MSIRLIKVTAIMGALAVASACSATRTQESAGEVIDDSVLTSKVKIGLIDDPVTKAGQINVETYRGVVQLGGFVDNTQQKSRPRRWPARSRASRRSATTCASARSPQATAGQDVDDSIADGDGQGEAHGGFDDQGVPDQRRDAKGRGAADRVRRIRRP